MRVRSSVVHSVYENQYELDVVSHNQVCVWVLQRIEFLFLKFANAVTAAIAFVPIAQHAVQYALKGPQPCLVIIFELGSDLERTIDMRTNTKSGGSAVIFKSACYPTNGCIHIRRIQISHQCNIGVQLSSKNVTKLMRCEKNIKNDI